MSGAAHGSPMSGTKVKDLMKSKKAKKDKPNADKKVELPFWKKKK